MAEEESKKKQTMITVSSSDGKEFEVEKAVAIQWEIIRDMIEDDCVHGCIPLPNVSSRILSMVIEYCDRHAHAGAAGGAAGRSSEAAWGLQNSVALSDSGSSAPSEAAWDLEKSVALSDSGSSARGLENWAAEVALSDCGSSQDSDAESDLGALSDDGSSEAAESDLGALSDAESDLDDGSSEAARDLKNWDAEFAQIDHGTLCELRLAADYLNIKGLMDLTTNTFVEALSGKTTEEMRKNLNVENDFTAEEEEEIRKENQWAFSDEE